jgi:putative membrane protein
MSGIAMLLVFVHVTANVVWIGSILAVAIIVSSGVADNKTRGMLGVEVYKKLAVPAFLVSFITGASRLAADTGYYFSATKFMHGKLFFALIVIALHHVIGGRAKRMAAGTVAEAKGVPALALTLLVAASGAVYLVVFKPF